MRIGGCGQKYDDDFKGEELAGVVNLNGGR
jgi:hypothetical protein